MSVHFKCLCVPSVTHTKSYCVLLRPAHRKNCQIEFTTRHKIWVVTMWLPQHASAAHCTCFAIFFLANRFVSDAKSTYRLNAAQQTVMQWARKIAEQLECVFLRRLKTARLSDSVTPFRVELLHQIAVIAFFVGSVAKVIRYNGRRCTYSQTCCKQILDMLMCTGF